MVMYTSLYLNWITNKVLLYSIGNSAQHYVAAWMYNPIQNKKLKETKASMYFISLQPQPDPILPQILFLLLFFQLPVTVPSGILLSRPMWQC